MCSPMAGMWAPRISFQGNRCEDWAQLYGSEPEPRSQPREATILPLPSP